MGWYIRDEYDDFTPDRDYEGNPSLFSAKIFYGGFFRRVPSRRYLQGRSVYVDYIDIDEFSVHEVDWMMRELKFLKEKVPLYYHFQIPGKDLDTGLVALGCDADVRNVSKYVGENKLINFYIEQGTSMVDTYLKSPEGSKVVIEELAEENQEIVGVRQNKKKLVPRRRLMLE
ncbi:hypothetical protein HanPI659440_Chr14g0565111 [Helianthus annuus]|nr:hypothetical protein HanPI659440_Chr14g0565111 [Helianthus annuus]